MAKHMLLRGDFAKLIDGEWAKIRRHWKKTAKGIPFYLYLGETKTGARRYFTDSQYTTEKRLTRGRFARKDWLKWASTYNEKGLFIYIEAGIVPAELQRAA